MKKNYVSPEVEIEKFNLQGSLITTSIEIPDGGDIEF